MNSQRASASTNRTDILVIALKYHHEPDNPYLTNILVSCLRERGMIVNVIALGDVDHQGPVETEAGREFYFGFSSGRRFTKYLGMIKIALQVFRDARRYNLSGSNLIVFAPVCLYFPIFRYFAKRAPKSICIVFDFFPKHQCELKVIPQFLLKPLRWVESRLINQCDLVTAMTPANKRCIVTEYGVPAEKVKLLPLWVPLTNTEDMKATDDQTVPSSTDNSGTLQIVFGGQLTDGRSIDYAIEFLELLRLAGLDLCLSVFSSGPQYEKMSMQNRLSWVKYLPRLPAVEYRRALPGFDIGLAVTDERVSLPTFPSKIPEYLLSGVRVLCFLEEANDVDTVFTDHTLVHVNRFTNTEESRKSAMVFCQACLEPMTSLDIDKASSFFSVDMAAKRLQEMLSHEG